MAAWADRKHIFLRLLRGRGTSLPVKTKSIYDPPEPEDGVRVLITRYYPRGVKRDRFDRRIIALSPSRALLSSYRDREKDWDEFSESFLSELRANPESLEAIQSLHALSLAQEVTLLCYERSGAPCHRYLVRDMVVAPGHLSRGRPDVGQEGTKVSGVPRNRTRSRNRLTHCLFPVPPL